MIAAPDVHAHFVLQKRSACLHSGWCYFGGVEDAHGLERKLSSYGNIMP